MQNQKTILVVDDKPNNSELLFQALKDAGYRVLISQTSQQALWLVKLTVPDIILLDVEIEEKDNFTSCRKFKTNSITKDIPLVFITASVKAQSKLKSWEGTVNYITKPLEPAELLFRIETCLRIENLRQCLTFEAQQRQLLFALADRLSQSGDLDSIFNTATAETRNLLKCDRLSLIRLTHKEISIESQSFAENISCQHLPQLTVKNFCAVNKESKISVISQAYKLENFKSLSSSLGSSNTYYRIQTRLFAPILLKHSAKADNHLLWGWLVAEQCSPRRWQEQELIFFQHLTTQLSIGIKQELLARQSQQYDRSLKQFALQDPLTQAFNRRYFQRQLDLEWRRLKRIAAPLSIIFCDIDYFKLYNDTYGYRAGDWCLQRVAGAISEVLERPADFLARYGGEEFVAILPYTPIQGATKVAEAMREAVKQLQIPHCNSSVDSVVTISVGVGATVPNSEDEPNMLVEAADKALFRAKNCGRDRVAVYQYPVAQAKYQQEHELEWDKRIRHALKENLFSLYAQPITSLGKTDSKRHFEILLRLQQEDRILTPNAFFDVAERNCLMSSIDTWVIDRLFEKLAVRDSSDWQNYQFSVNLSGASLNNESFLDFLSQKLAQYHLPPQLFCFEITEAIAIDNIDRIRDFILSLKALGCSFALDDFGKGMSSLTYLKNLPVDYLKIDGSFITELNKDKISRVMVEAIEHLAIGIGLKTVAEFVENQDILDTLRHLKIDYAQGYHLGRPQKFADIVD